MKRVLVYLLMTCIALGMLPVALAEGTAVPSEITAEAFRTPDVQYRPGVRWWWALGAETEDLVSQVDYLADNFFGTAEIISFNAGFVTGQEGTAFKPSSAEDTLYPDARLFSYETPEFYEKLEAVIAEAAKKGVIVDLSMGTGYEANSTFVKPEESMEQMALGIVELTVAADQVGQAVEVAIPDYARSEIYTTYANGVIEGVDLDIAWPQLMLIGRVTGEKEIVKGGFFPGGAAPSDPEYQDVLDPASLVLIDISEKAAGEVVSFTPDAEGEWRAAAMYCTASGSLPLRGIYGNGVYSLVTDHMEAEDVKSYIHEWLGAEGMASIFEQYGDSIRAGFNDSYEFYLDNYYNHAMVELAADAENNGAGYDMTTYLPLFAKDSLAAGPLTLDLTDDELTRLTYDHDLMVDKLFQEGMQAFSDALKDFGMVYRQQAYNPPIDVLKSSKYVDIPETEGLVEVSLKQQASGAHLYGKDMVSAEVFTLGTSPYQTTTADIRDGLDALITGGVTLPLYHGLSSIYFGSEEAQAAGAYGDQGWRGWPGIGIEVGEVNPISDSFKAINTYDARLNYLASQGSYDGDALVYLPLFGDIAEGDFLFKSAPEYLKCLDNYGFTWDCVNDDCIQNEISYSDGKLTVAASGAEYDTLVLCADRVPLATMQALQALAEQGANIVLVGNLPSTQPGYADGRYAELDAQVVEITAGMTALDNVYTVEKNSEAIGDLMISLCSAPICHENNAFTSVLRRKLASGGSLLFIRNTGAEANTVRLLVDESLVNCYWLDQETGCIYRAEKSGDGAIELLLEAKGSIALLCEPEGVAIPEADVEDGEPLPILRAEPTATYALSDLTLTVTANNLYDGKLGETQTVTFDENVIGDWTQDDFHDGALKYVDQPGIFEGTLHLENPDGRYILKLGSISAFAKVFVNDEEAGLALYGDYDVDITAALRDGDNAIRIELQPIGHNRRAGFSRAYRETGDPQYAYYYEYVNWVEFGLADDALMPVGLFAPVTVAVY